NEALLLARRVYRTADEMGVLRYADLAQVLECLAVVAIGERINRAVVMGVLRRLPQHSGLEAWRLTAEVAAATNDVALRELAAAYAARLARHARDHAANFEQYAETRLDRMRSGAL